VVLDQRQKARLDRAAPPRGGLLDLGGASPAALALEVEEFRHDETARTSVQARRLGEKPPPEGARRLGKRVELPDREKRPVLGDEAAALEDRVGALTDLDRERPQPLPGRGAASTRTGRPKAEAREA
jgi:hypothetical protein